MNNKEQRLLGLAIAKIKSLNRELNGCKQTISGQEAIIGELRRQTTIQTNGNITFDEATLDQDISCMGLSVRPYNCLWRAGIKKVRDLYKLPSAREFEAIRNLGKKSQREVILRMRSMGFTDWADRMNNYRGLEP